MNRWENNALLYGETGKSGKCPDCGSDRVRVEEFKKGRHYSISFFCEDCKSGDHFDGVIPGD